MRWSKAVRRTLHGSTCDGGGLPAAGNDKPVRAANRCQDNQMSVYLTAADSFPWWTVSCRVVQWLCWWGQPTVPTSYHPS